MRALARPVVDEDSKEDDVRSNALVFLMGISKYDHFKCLDGVPKDMAKHRHLWFVCSLCTVCVHMLLMCDAQGEAVRL